MRVEIIELLRCPAKHELTPLVTVAFARDGDRLLEGVLGCPVCHAEYTLHNGVAMLGTERSPQDEPANDVDAMRTAALLGLDEVGARVLLAGDYATPADAIEQATDVRCIAANALRRTMFNSADALCADRDHAIPLANATLHGIAIDNAHLSWLDDAVRVVRVGGRILAPSHAPVPKHCQELARDEHEWVAVVSASSGTLVDLKRAGATA